MTVLRLWAPKARQIEVAGGGQRLSMTRADDTGWWAVRAPFVQHGADYAFYVDGDGPLPDPRSPWQPEGVHGPSRWVDHGRFAWAADGFQPPPLASAVIYELHIGTFTAQGTFDSAIERLGHLAELGVTHVELMPVAEFAGARGWGYDGVDLYAPHHAYGGPDGLKRFVDACHARGLAVLLDVVYNHLGPCGNYLSRFGPYFTKRYTSPWGEAVNFDGPDSGEVRRFFIDNALMWLRDYRIDGLRIDAVHGIVDMSAIHFLEQLASEVRRLSAHLGRHLALIAESDLNDPRAVRPPELGGYGLDAQWNEDFHHALHAALTGERGGYYRDFGSLKDIATALTEGFVYAGRYSAFRRRPHGRPARDLPGWRFVGCLQNHDQVGNRAEGERTSHLLTPGQQKIGAALVMLSPFVPLLFQGEEWGALTPFLYFTSFDDPALGQAVKDGRRQEFAAFGWDPEKIADPQAEDTFSRSKLDWAEREQGPHAEMLRWHRDLIALRARKPELAAGSLGGVEARYDESARWLTLARGTITLACNLASDRQRIPLAGIAHKKIVLASAEDIAMEEHAIALPGHAVAILDEKREQALAQTACERGQAFAQTEGV